MISLFIMSFLYMGYPWKISLEKDMIHFFPAFVFGVRFTGKYHLNMICTV